MYSLQSCLTSASLIQVPKFGNTPYLWNKWAWDCPYSESELCSGLLTKKLTEQKCFFFLLLNLNFLFWICSCGTLKPKRGWEICLVTCPWLELWAGIIIFWAGGWYSIFTETALLLLLTQMSYSSWLFSSTLIRSVSFCLSTYQPSQKSHANLLYVEKQPKGI